MSSDLADVRRLIVMKAGETSAAEDTLASLARIEAELERGRQTEARLTELTDSLFALASLDFEKMPKVLNDGTLIDAAAGCVTMLAEELAAQLNARERHEALLEQRVKERSEQLVQATKLAGVGQLAAGIAHEINNPLAVILGFAQGIERRLPSESPELVKPVRSIVREALRCKKLVEELLTFSRVKKRGREPLRVEALISNTVPLLQARARAQDTHVSFEVAPGVPQVLGDPAQLESVMINLGVNALDALGHGGHVLFRVLCVGSNVEISVEDDGPGIPPGVRPHIFEPFFTTKEPGKGTGLGLSLSWEIVQQHGGTFDVETEVGRGTAMKVRLPRVAQAVERTAAGAP
ncbi:MAG: hypothetical protein JNK82_35890 [Myxococcaceae bacterium]|nr:hypothetical protein [Myxococcaceae bacterium]